MFVSERGFTLLETLVALTIASVALVVLSQEVRSSLALADRTARLDQAISRARSHIAAAEHGKLAPGQQGGDDGGGYRWHISTRPDKTSLPGLIADPKAPSLTLFTLTATISWDDGAAGHAISLTTQAIGPATDQPP